MGQPAPDVPPNLPLGSNNGRRIPSGPLGREGDGTDGNAGRLDGASHLTAHLRPPPLFRSIGLTGLSASLPPHRRLRSVLHRERAVLPVAAGRSAESWSRAHSGNWNRNTIPPGAPDDGMPFRGLLHSGLQPNYESHAASRSQNDYLPDISTHKLGLSRIRHGTGSCRESHSVSEARILRANGSRAGVDNHAHSHLGPSNSVTDILLTSTVSTEERLSCPGRRLSAKPRVGCRKSMVCPFIQGDVRSSETAVMAGKRQRRKINNSGECSQSEHTLTPEKGREDDLCHGVHSLGITDRGEDPTPANRKEAQSGCGQKLANRRVRMFKTEPGDKGVCQTRRDRRPHFLPPISQSDCLLNVPLILPENSPPPSPSCMSAGPFFPLHVPAPPCSASRGHRETLKHT